MIELCVVFFLNGVAVPGEIIQNGGWACRPQPSIAKCIERRDYAQTQSMGGEIIFSWYCRRKNLKDFG